MTIQMRSAARALLTAFLLISTTAVARAAEPDDRVPAPLGDAEAGDPAQGTTIAPRRATDVFELEASIAPTYTFNASRTALLASSGLTYRGRESYFVRASIGPVGGAFGESAHVAFGTITTGFDLRFFELGVGAGVARSADGATFPCKKPNDECTRDDRSGPAMLVAFDARLGARDGFHLSVRTTRAVVDHRNHFGTLDVSVQIPIVASAALFIRGGTSASQIGLHYGGFGLRARVFGDGGRGSLYVSPGASFIGLDFDDDDDVRYILGIAGTLNVEYRL